MRLLAAKVSTILLLSGGCATVDLSRSTIGSTEWVFPSVEAQYESDIKELQVGTDLLERDRIITKNTGRTHIRLINRSDLLFGPNCRFDLDDSVTETRPVGTKLVNYDWQTNPFSKVECVAELGASSSNPISVDFGTFAIFVTNRLVTLDRVKSRFPFCGIAALRLFIDGRIDDAIEDGYVEITARDRNVIIDKLQNAIIIEICDESLRMRALGVDEHLDQVRNIEDQTKIKRGLKEPDDDDPPIVPPVPGRTGPETTPDDNETGTDPGPQDPSAGRVNLGVVQTDNSGIASIPVADILANSTDPQGNGTLSLTGVGNAAGQSDSGQPVKIAGGQNTNSVEYNTNSTQGSTFEFGTPDTFDFTITDQDGNSDTGKAEITIPEPPPPLVI